MKKYLFMLAIPALFAACSSDDAAESPVTPVVPQEEAVTVQAIGLDNNTVITIGDVEETSTMNRVSVDNQFTEAKVVLFLSRDVLQDEFEVVADDFYIRKDSVLQNIDVIDPDNEKVPHYAYISDDILVKDNRNLGVGVEGLENLDAWNATTQTAPEWTFEIWMTIKNEKEQLKEGTTDWYEKVPLFTDAMYDAWITGGAFNTESGTDVTNLVSCYLERTATTGGNGFYEVRYNVFRGLKGNGIDPYIKVSIHVKRLDVAAQELGTEKPTANKIIPVAIDPNKK